ncbi:sulfurtransferase-like selenium metabolism protein YedF [Sedimentibacter hydroxybenzoicus DSM 7310]|uniref:Sulfurtransferase-like selenium metabolism protein YedF n=1 Tax=Sedimentibacter hydroxybenzoicus DSM 7310 TaxID=1123245 RepID=A0A974BHH9_SEDHY|nr:sulfurtransferase-like selenium metabolism protein YedF [Sedimentibacter hydroxybenzoicus]NYB73021.1 sulfurtransferase-like selenium metabolism protein YedF [Sedimentibacter hydroxybenzoicus DSM 7310]
MKLVDARGLACPQPVLLTKKEADSGELKITVIVDNDTAKQNVTKFGTKLQYDIKSENKEDGIYITLSKANEHEDIMEAAIVIEKNSTKSGYVITTDKLGKGSDDLGKILMKSFLYTLSETKPYPEFLIFLNSGVKLTTLGSDSLEDLKKLNEDGVKIVSCGTCLDFFEIKSNLQVGSISNMYDIVEIITESEKTITI